MALWRRLVELLIAVALLFLAFPIHLPPPELINAEEDFHTYLLKFNKTYRLESKEYSRRFEAFKNSLSNIKLFNLARTHNDTALYGLTQFSDLTKEEFLANHLAKPVKSKRKQHNEDNETTKTDTSSEEHRVRRYIIPDGLPQRVDWRKKGIISDVKNQGSCGACWAFSTIHTMEAMYAKTHNLTLLSVQEAIDCAKDGNYGCLGGDICALLDWLMKYNVSIQLENDYPLSAKVQACHFNTSQNSTGVRIKKYSCVSLVGSEDVLLKWIAYNGPAAVAINALSWQNYLGGVIQYHCDGHTTALNHAVQIVGYDLTAEIPYYIAKNSWGTSFGNYGYVHLAIGQNICGVVDEVSMIDVY